jgi:hypothetical protein
VNTRIFNPLSVLLVWLAMVCLGASFSQAASLPPVSLKGDVVHVQVKGKDVALSADDYPAMPIEGKEMHYLGIGEDQAKPYGLAAGLYVFNADGSLAAFTPNDAAEMCSDVRFSPNGKILAMDAGSSPARDWFFYSYPDMKPMGNIGWIMVPDKPWLTWVGDRGVLVSYADLDDVLGRECGYDPCGPVSVNYFDFGSGKLSTLLKGTGLCDYSVSGLAEDGKTAQVDALCVKSLGDWKEYPGDDVPRKQTTVKLP